MTTLLYETHWTDPADGWAIASRAYARAMLAAGVDVHLHSWTAMTEDVDPAVAAEIGAMSRRLPNRRWDAYVFSTTLSNADRMRMLCGELRQYARPRMLYTTFEREQVHPSIAEFMNELDGVWVPCNANKAALVDAGAERVFVAPHCFFPDDPLLRLRERSSLHPKPRFYWIGRWEPRKNPATLLRAFCHAFDPGQATLTLKIGQLPWKGDYPGPEVVLNAFEHWRDDVTVIRGRVPREALVRLHADNDFYVSASRGEGWDLPSFEAKLAGNRVLTTDSGGPLDFVGRYDLLVPRVGSVPADPLYDWGFGATYATHDFDVLVERMRLLARSTVRTPADDMGAFSAATVGASLRQWLLEKVANAPTDRPPLQEPATALYDWLKKS